MGSKLMVELLRRGKTGNDILKILDAVTGESSKLGVEEKEMNATGKDKNRPTKSKGSKMNQNAKWKGVNFLRA